MDARPYPSERYQHIVHLPNGPIWKSRTDRRLPQGVIENINSETHSGTSEYFVGGSRFNCERPHLTHHDKASDTSAERRPSLRKSKKSDVALVGIAGVNVHSASHSVPGYPARATKSIE